MLFHKDVGANVAVTNFMTHFSMFVPTKANIKFYNGNMGHAQVIGIILYRFPICTIKYLVVPVYYFPGHPSSTISSGDLNFYVNFQKVSYEPLEHCEFIEPQGHYWRSPYHTQNNLDYLQIEIVKANPQKNRNIVVPNFYALSKQNLSRIIH